MTREIKASFMYGTQDPSLVPDYTQIEDEGSTISLEKLLKITNNLKLAKESIAHDIKGRVGFDVKLTPYRRSGFIEEYASRFDVELKAQNARDFDEALWILINQVGVMSVVTPHGDSFVRSAIEEVLGEKGYTMESKWSGNQGTSYHVQKRVDNISNTG